MRIIDIQLVWDVVVATREGGRGPRRRVAEKHGVAPSTITEAIKRFDLAMDVSLFAPQPDTDELALTIHGEAFARHGATFLASYQLLRRLVQQADH